MLNLLVAVSVLLAQASVVGAFDDGGFRATRRGAIARPTRRGSIRLSGTWARQTCCRCAADVAKLGVMVGGEPLVTQDKTLLKKHPNAIAPINGGWFVKTHSGTAAKVRYVKTIAKALKVKVVVAGA